MLGDFPIDFENEKFLQFYEDCNYLSDNERAVVSLFDGECPRICLFLVSTPVLDSGLDFHNSHGFCLENIARE